MTSWKGRYELLNSFNAFLSYHIRYGQTYKEQVTVKKRGKIRVQQARHSKMLIIDRQTYNVVRYSFNINK